MKPIFILLLCALPTFTVKSQTIAFGKTTTFSYDTNGNIISRKGQTPPSVRPGDGNGKIDISGDISIIGKDNKFTIDIKKDYGSTATLQVSDLTPMTVKTTEFSKRTYTVDMSDCPSGIYIFNVKVADREGTKKIIKD